MLGQLESWSERNGTDRGKNVLLQYTFYRPSSQLTLGSKTIHVATSLKCLVLNIDNKLPWQKICKNFQTKIKKYLQVEVS